MRPFVRCFVVLQPFWPITLSTLNPSFLHARRAAVYHRHSWKMHRSTGYAINFTPLVANDRNEDAGERKEGGGWRGGRSTRRDHRPKMKLVSDHYPMLNWRDKTRGIRSWRVIRHTPYTCFRSGYAHPHSIRYRISGFGIMGSAFSALTSCARI